MDEETKKYFSELTKTINHILDLIALHPVAMALILKEVDKLKERVEELENAQKY